MATFKQIRRAIRRPFETAGFLLLKQVIPLMPRRIVIGLSRFIGYIACMVPSREKRYALINLDAVFGDTKTAAEKRKIIITSYSSFCLTMLDLFWFSKNSKQRISKLVRFNQGEATDAFFSDQPVVCIGAHYGNWEIMGQATALGGAKISSIAAEIKNKTVNDLLIRRREKTGQNIIPQKGALRTLISRLKKREMVGFVLDQHTGPEEGGIRVEFLGLPMSVSSAPAALAYRTGAEIIAGFCCANKNGSYSIRMLDAIVPPAYDKEADTDVIIHDLTQQIEDAISKQIRTYPEYWLWSYKHFRRTPGEEYPDHYPNY